QLVEFVSTNLDRYLPFREKAPSVKRARTSQGPYAPEHLRTREGFFSALVFRTLVYGARYMFDHPFFFNNPTTLVQHNSSMTKPDGKPLPKSYFVDNSIYGSRTSRTIADVERLWDATAQDIPFNFTTAGTENHRHPFTAFYEKAKRKEPKRVYPQCGDLIGYLLTADYVYVGVVAMPSVPEMGALIHTIAKGALFGLGVMGLIQ
ncbi:hypothetical protein FA95DRAFT_1473767, partial [Auriscalpium vulgare]